MKSLIKTAVFVFSLVLAFPVVAKEAVSNPININTASSEQLMALPGVGPQIARAIIEGRLQKAYQSSADLLQVKGVGEKRLAEWEGLITYGPLEPPSTGASSARGSSSAPQLASKPGGAPAHP